jgi:uncharacterized protein YlxW (UPF0749 family)
MTDVQDRVTMPLLARITSQALDEDYAHVAERRAAGELTGGARSATWWTWLAVIVLVGALLAVAGAQTSEQAVDRASGRATLISRIQAERAVLRDTQARVGRFQAATVALQNEVDRTDEELDAIAAELRRLRTRTGYGPVRGPGVRLVVTDSESETVRDEDLALLVNGLWTAGAEAIAINGERLTPLTYIQNSGPAINVNSQPLVAPYTVEAIGDQRTLQANLLESSSGARFTDLVRLLGFGFEQQNVDELTLRGAGLRRLRTASSGLSGEPPRPIGEGGTP